MCHLAFYIPLHAARRAMTGQQTGYHLFTVCRAWLPQTRGMRRTIGKANRWLHPRAPAIKWLWKEKSTEVVLGVLRDTRIGCISTRRVLPGGRLGDEMSGSGGEGKKGDRAPRICNFLFFPSFWGMRENGCFSFLSFSFCLFTFALFDVWGRRRGVPYYNRRS